MIHNNSGVREKQAAPTHTLSPYELVQNRDSGAEKPPQAAASAVVGAGDASLRAGTVQVSWRILQSHVLRNSKASIATLFPDSPLKSSSSISNVDLEQSGRRSAEAFAAVDGISSDAAAQSHLPFLQGEFDWLLSVGREREKEQQQQLNRSGSGAAFDSIATATATSVVTTFASSSVEESVSALDLKYLDRDVKTFPVCTSTFPIPAIKVSLKLFIHFRLLY